MSCSESSGRRRQPSGTPPPPEPYGAGARDLGAPPRFRVTSDATVRIAVYDAARTLRAAAEGSLQLALPPGLYRVHFERCGAVHHELVDHGRGTELSHPGPPLRSPVPFTGAATTHDHHAAAARRFSLEDTGPPLGDGPATGRLFVLVRRVTPGAPGRDPADDPARALPGEPLAIYDVRGGLLTTITEHNAKLHLRHGYLACSLPAAPGTYRLRAMRSRRSVALTVLAGRAAQVFLADTDAVRLDELRAALVPAGAAFDPDRPIWRAMEGVLEALRAPDRPLPLAARALLPAAVGDDLCFAIAAAHVLLRGDDRAGFAAVMERLAPYAALPDVAILARLHRPDLRRPPPAAPPLLRASLTAAMTRAELARDVAADSVLAEVARTRLHDSPWCTWTGRRWDERWIEPTVEGLRALEVPAPEAPALARRLALPIGTVEQALRALAARAAATGAPTVHIPGYAIGGVIGRGALSTVYGATRLDDGRGVALKVLAAPPRPGRRALAGDPAARGHPGVVAPTAGGRLPDDAGAWFEMERCRGSALDVMDRTNAPVPLAEACRLVLDALGGVGHLHRHGLVHGHLTPANLLIRDDGSAAVPDLMLVTPWARAREPQRSLLAHFVAPEVLRGACPPTPAGDVWSMAATLYFMLTLEACDPARGAIVPLALYRDDVPRELARCIERALSPACDDRPRHAGAFLACLRAVT